MSIKISGDGARMTRLTNYVILSYCMLDENEDVFSAKGIFSNAYYASIKHILNNQRLYYIKGTNTIAVMSEAECYESLKCNFKDCWEEINQVIEDGQVEIDQGQTAVPIPIEIFLGGDYKVV